MRKPALAVLTRREGPPTYIERRHALSRLCVVLVPEWYEDFDRELLSEATAASPRTRARGTADLSLLIVLRLQMIAEQDYPAWHPRWRTAWLDSKLEDAIVALGELPAKRPDIVVGLRLLLVGGASRFEIETIFTSRQSRAAA